MTNFKKTFKSITEIKQWIKKTDGVSYTLTGRGSMDSTQTVFINLKGYCPLWIYAAKDDLKTFLLQMSTLRAFVELHQSEK